MSDICKGSDSDSKGLLGYLVGNRRKLEFHIHRLYHTGSTSKELMMMVQDSIVEVFDSSRSIAVDN